MADHLADNGSHLPGVELKHGAQCGDGQCVVEGRICEQVSAQTLLLNLLSEHRLDVLGAWHELPDLDAVDEVRSLLPLTSREGLGRLHDVVAGVLGRAGKDLALMVFEHTAICLADDALLDIGRRTSLSQQRDLKKHAAGQVHTLQELKVDVHVEG